MSLECLYKEYKFWCYRFQLDDMKFSFVVDIDDNAYIRIEAHSVAHDCYKIIDIPILDLIDSNDSNEEFVERVNDALIKAFESEVKE